MPAAASIATARMIPSRAAAGAMGRWTCRLEIGTPGLVAGALIYLQLPDSWHRGAYNGAKGVQSVDPSAANFVSVESSRSDTRIRCQVVEGTTDPFILTPRVGIDGRSHRLVWVVRLELQAGALRPGDVVDVTWGAGRGPDAGFRASANPYGPERVLLAVDPQGSGSPSLVRPDALPTLEVVPAEPAEVVLTAPSILAVGEQGALRLAVVDAFANAVSEFEGPVLLRVLTGDTEIASKSVIRRGGTGTVRIPYRPTQPGVVRVEAEVPGVGRAVGNPTVCVSERPALRLYWGDLHSHSELSYDGVGKDPFTYARDVAALDFYANTEHSEWWPEGTWETIRERNRRFNRDGEFVTIPGYEATFLSPWGHHNIYLRDEDGPVMSRHDGTLLDLWQRLEGHAALTVPHHTGVHWLTPQRLQDPGVSPTPDWRYHDPRFRRLIEIYSLHGQSETYDPSHALAYENCDFTWGESVRGPYYATDAWERGHRLGVVAGSDDHGAQPGRGQGGTTAVWAPRLARADIWDALAARRCYGTTGSRIALSMSVGGVSDVQEVPWQASTAVKLDVHGTDGLASVELVEIDLHAGRTQVVRHEEAFGLDASWSWTVEPASKRVAYYARVRQRNTYRGRAVMAWTSPVWLEDAAR